MASKEELQKEFDKVSEVAAKLTTDLIDLAPALRKNEILRVFLGVLEYPVPPSKKFRSQEEHNIYQMAVGLKEMQMKLGVINLAIKEQEANGTQEATNE